MSDTATELQKEEINWTVKKQEAIQKLDRDLITQLGKPEAKEKNGMSAEEAQIAGYLALADKVTAAANELREAVKHEKTYLIKKQIEALGLTAADLGLDTKVEVVIERDGNTDTEPKDETIKFLTRTGEVLVTGYKGRITANNGYTAEMLEFWGWAQKQNKENPFTRTKKSGDGTTVQKVDSNYLKKVSDDELKELCKAYYAAA